MARTCGKEANEEEMVKDQRLNSKFEEFFSILIEMGKVTEPRFEEFHAIMRELAGKAADQKSKENSEVTKEEASCSKESRKGSDADHTKVAFQEEKIELLFPCSQRLHEMKHKKKNVSRDDGPRQNEDEETSQMCEEEKSKQEILVGSVRLEES